MHAQFIIFYLNSSLKNQDKPGLWSHSLREETKRAAQKP